MDKSDKKSRFKRVATRRTKNVLKSLQVLGHCANLQAYSYTEEEVASIFGAIEKQFRATKNKFAGASIDKIDFKL